jgi:hypothetical protein
MAKVTLNPSVASITGKIGDLVYRRLWGREVVNHLPDFSRRVLSEKQLAQVSRLTTGSIKWKALAPEVKSLYRARAKELQMPTCALYQRTNSRPPVVQDIDLSQYTGQPGQTIRIAATDLVDVAEVEVIIREGGGAKLETGQAARPINGDGYWVYQTTASASVPAGLTVEAIAANWPSRTGSRMQMLGG